MQSVEQDLQRERSENDTRVKSLLSEQGAMQERLTKMSFEHSSMKEQLKAATEMVRRYYTGVHPGLSFAAQSCCCS